MPSGAVNTLAEAYAHKQVQHLGLVQKVCHHNYGEITLTGMQLNNNYKKSLFNRL